MPNILHSPDDVIQVVKALFHPVHLVLTLQGLKELESETSVTDRFKGLHYSKCHEATETTTNLYCVHEFGNYRRQYH